MVPQEDWHQLSIVIISINLIGSAVSEPNRSLTVHDTCNVTVVVEMCGTTSQRSIASKYGICLTHEQVCNQVNILWTVNINEMNAFTMWSITCSLCVLCVWSVDASHNAPTPCLCGFQGHTFQLCALIQPRLFVGPCLKSATWGTAHTKESCLTLKTLITLPNV